MSAWWRLALLLSVGLGGALRAHSEAATPPPIPLNVALLRDSLVRLNENDAKAAIGVLAREIARNVGYEIAPHVDIFDSQAGLKNALEVGHAQILMVSLWDLLALGSKQDLEISYVCVVGGQTSTRWLLLTRHDAPHRTLADLRGKSVLVLHNATAHLGTPWIETRLLELGLGTPAEFFGRYQLVDKSSAAALPVFFNRADACIVDEVSFDTLRTLNPQLGRTLAAIEQTDPLPNPVVCLTREGWATPQFRRDAYEEFGRLGREPAGRQLLTLFKCDALAPFRAEQIDTVSALFRRHQRARSVEASR